MDFSFRRVEPFPRLRWVFLDRDGVINRKAAEGKYISEWSNFEVLPGAEEAIGRLNRAGCRVIVLSNQRGVALGLYTEAAVHHLHARFQAHLRTYGAHIDGFYFCPHDEGQCTCRKPALGLFEQAVRDTPAITPQTSVMIGDSISDIVAARHFGCRSVFVEGDLTTSKQGADRAKELADGVAGSLAEAVESLLVV
jgi:D-glycero-D-manno-heptose 1,7-bisphosphate phosphatase